MTKLNISTEIFEGVDEGLRQAPSPANTLNGRMTIDEAKSARKAVYSAKAFESITAIEHSADSIGRIALRDPVLALELLGGEDTARDIMGDVATNHLLTMIATHEGKA